MLGAKETKLLSSIRDLSYPERLAKLKLPSLEHRHRRGDLIELFKFIKGIYKCDNPKFTIIEDRSTRGHSLKIEKNHHRLQLRGNFFTQRVINSWNSLPEEVVASTSVECFKIRLDKFWEDNNVSAYNPDCYTET